MVITRALAIVLGGLALAPRAAAAHAGEPLAPHDLWTAWPMEPGVWLGLGLGAVLYVRGVREGWRRAGRGRLFPPAQLWTAALAFLVLFTALASPIHALGDALFSGHMVQHLLLITIAAPLILRADVFGAVLRGLPLRTRRGLVRHLRRSGAWYAWEALSLPIPALLLHAGTVWLWHLPTYYDAAVVSAGVHALEHGTMLVTALLFWRPVLSRARVVRLQGGLAVLYIFVFGMQAALLGALLTFASGPWYAAHQATVGAWGLDALEDQRLAGAIMWVPGGIAYLIAAARVFLGWMAELERHSPAAVEVPS